ncbi:squalene/phytoene synthase family protein [Streptomyces sp. NPDC047022]|uniref:squalene/phytoene synthase family protein n=1 Tax=Streptomyces sp. NPDC047022 TaxID=3155737 RepID=UPI00340E0548
MNAWNQGLNAAGIREPGLRSDYDTQRRLVSRFRRTSYMAAKVLLPPEALPHAMAATAVMHHGDNLLDTGTKERRAAAWSSWERRIREGLESGTSDDPLIRTLLHTVAACPRLAGTVEEYLSTARAELEFSRFADEADYQAYLDAYALPAFMLVGVLAGPEDDDGRYRAACRTFIDGSQRLDFVNDLSEDLREGVLGIPVKTMERFSVTEEDLRAGHDCEAVRELVRDQVGAARATLETARGLPALTATPYKPLMGALVEIELLTADAALARGAGLLRGPAGPPPVRALRVLWDARRRARKERRRASR